MEFILRWFGDVGRLLSDERCLGLGLNSLGLSVSLLLLLSVDGLIDVFNVLLVRLELLLFSGLVFLHLLLLSDVVIFLFILGSKSLVHNARIRMPQKLLCPDDKGKFDNRVDAQEPLVFEILLLRLAVLRGLLHFLVLILLRCFRLLSRLRDLLDRQLQRECDFLALTVHIVEHGERLRPVEFLLLLVMPVKRGFLGRIMGVFNHLPA